MVSRPYGLVWGHRGNAGRTSWISEGLSYSRGCPDYMHVLDPRGGAKWRSEDQRWTPAGILRGLARAPVPLPCQPRMGRSVAGAPPRQGAIIWSGARTKIKACGDSGKGACKDRARADACPAQRAQLSDKMRSSRAKGTPGHGGTQAMAARGPSGARIVAGLRSTRATGARLWGVQAAGALDEGAHVHGHLAGRRRQRWVARMRAPLGVQRRRAADSLARAVGCGTQEAGLESQCRTVSSGSKLVPKLPRAAGRGWQGF